MTQTTRPTPRRRVTGFTIIELLVVISIMGIVIGTTAGAIAATVRSNARESGTNQVAAALNGARGLALRDGRDTAVLFEGDPADQQIRIRILLREPDTTVPTRVRFVARNDNAPEIMPSYIILLGKNKVGEVVAASTPDWLGPAHTTFAPGVDFEKPLIVWFDADGTIKNRPPGVTEIYYDRPGAGFNTYDASESVIPVPLLAIFDARDFAEDETTPQNMRYEDSSDGDRDNFIRNAGNNDRSVLYFNRYTGNLMKR